MTKGVLLFAVNNDKIDYVKQAIFCAKKVKEHLELPVALVTPNKPYLQSAFPFYKDYIDEIIVIPDTHSKQVRTFYDGAYTTKKLTWNNLARPDAYALTPFQQTLVIDTDLIICNNQLNAVFDTKDDFLIYKNFTEIAEGRSLQPFNRVSDRSIDLVWATGFYFVKSPKMDLYFELVKHIQENWEYYRLTYQIAQPVYRNDYAFSIAIHIMNGFKKEQWPNSLPGKVYFVSDRDILSSIDNNTLVVVADKVKDVESFAVRLSDKNVHVMNKFSLIRAIDREFENE